MENNLEPSKSDQLSRFSDQSQQAAPVVIHPHTPVHTPQPKRNGFYFLIGLLLLFAVAASAYALGQMNQPKPQPMTPADPDFIRKEPVIPTVLPQVQSDATASWKTYTIGDLVFKYPDEWSMQTNSRGMDIVLKPTNQSEEFPSVGIYRLDNPKNLTIKDYDAEMGKEGQSPGFYSNTIRNEKIVAEEMTVSGITGYYQKKTGCEPLLCSKFAIPYNKKIYVAQIIYPGEWDEKFGKTFDQILSTFKFTDQTSASDNSGWKTYSNTLLGYSLDFPNTWQAMNIAAGGSVAALPNSINVDVSDSTQASKPYPDGVISIQGLGALPTYDSSWTKSQVTVNGASATKFEKPDVESGLNGVVYLFKSTKGEYIEVLFRYGSADPEIVTFNQIIKTFKII